MGVTQRSSAVEPGRAKEVTSMIRMDINVPSMVICIEQQPSDGEYVLGVDPPVRATDDCYNTLDGTQTQHEIRQKVTYRSSIIALNINVDTEVAEQEEGVRNWSPSAKSK